jgi:hypothetical protein
LLLSLVAEGAAQWLVWIKFFHRCEGPWPRRAADGTTTDILGLKIPWAKEKLNDY